MSPEAQNGSQENVNSFLLNRRRVHAHTCPAHELLPPSSQPAQSRSPGLSVRTASQPRHASSSPSSLGIGSGRVHPAGSPSPEAGLGKPTAQPRPACLLATAQACAQCFSLPLSLGRHPPPPPSLACPSRRPSLTPHSPETHQSHKEGGRHGEFNASLFPSVSLFSLSKQTHNSTGWVREGKASPGTGKQHSLRRKSFHPPPKTQQGRPGHCLGEYAGVGAGCGEMPRRLSTRPGWGTW